MAPQNPSPTSLPAGGPLAFLAGFARQELVVIGLLGLGWALMFGPTYAQLATSTWASDEQGHGPIILGVSAWLLWRRAAALRALPAAPAPLAGGFMLVCGLLSYLLGRALSIPVLEAGAQVPVLMALLLLFKGWAGVRAAAFPLFFLIFMTPWPSDLVAFVTGPLKSAVSVVSANLLHAVGYPVGRSGVILTVGPYQLLVADACAGLNSMFTLEALGLLYLNLMNHTSVARNVALALAIIPISFAANVVRVCVLVLVTYHFGDEAGQGFLHGFSGMVLFAAALSLMLVFDHVFGELIDRRFGSRRATA